MQTKVGKFSYVIPAGFPQADEKVEKTFDYKFVDSAEEANAIIAEKKWNVATLVNDVLKANARSSAYQAALLPYKPSEVSPDEIKERMVRDYIRLGIPEAMARAQVDSLLKSMAVTADTEETESV